MKTILINKKKNDKPKIELTVQRVEASQWSALGFDKHHYLTHTLNPSAKCLVFCWGETPVGFIALLNSPRKGMRFGFSVSRLVLSPDFQGLGLSSVILNFCGGILKSLGDDHPLYIKTIHDKMGGWLTRSDNWQPTSYSGKERTIESARHDSHRYRNRFTRISYCFKYVGEAIYGYEELLLPIKELREKKKEKKIIQLSLFD